MVRGEKAHHFYCRASWNKKRHIGGKVFQPIKNAGGILHPSAYCVVQQSLWEGFSFWEHCIVVSRLKKLRDYQLRWLVD
ncbi:MAG: hypothetical protein EPGJADBJ_03784 [Saprospiraceae bacterium]|nr:hypothetical protein [Saprospiraceae bacterium]